MVNRRQLGMEYEQKVASVLEKHGYQILERNYRCKSGEIDLIALDMDCLVFVEVKYRNNDEIGRPEEAVDRKKQSVICRVADDYRMKHPQYETYQIRFDVAAVLGIKLKVYKNAFEYQWRQRWKSF